MKFEDLAVGVELIDLDIEGVPFDVEDVEIKSIMIEHFGCHYPEKNDVGFMRKGAVVWEIQFTEKGTWMCMTKYVSEFWRYSETSVENDAKASSRDTQ